MAEDIQRAGSKKHSFVLYFDIRKPLNMLNDADRGRLFLALFDYAEYGEVPDFNGELGMAFEFIRTALDRDAEKWDEKSKKRSAAGKIGGEVTQIRRRQNEANQANASFDKQIKQNEANQAVPVPAPVPVPVPVPVPAPVIIDSYINEADKPQKNHRFVPPTVEEVTAYCRERGNRVSPQCFVDFYTSKNWMVGKTKMSDWKAAVRTWERRGADKDISSVRNYDCEEDESL